jgi:signal transduction histidine kinase
LSIVRAIAEAHGGVVHVEDAKPRGSRFVITLPTATRIGSKQGEDTWPAS